MQEQELEDRTHVMEAERQINNNRKRTRIYDANFDKISAQLSSKNFKFELKTVYAESVVSE